MKRPQRPENVSTHWEGGAFIEKGDLVATIGIVRGSARELKLVSKWALKTAKYLEWKKQALKQEAKR